MFSRSIPTLTLIAAVGAGISGGVFFAFSTFIMKSLRRLPANQAVAAMQAINKDAQNPFFMTALFGTALVCVALGVGAVRNLDEAGAVYRALGASVYLVSIVLTAAYHVPKNDALAKVDPTGTDAVRAWAGYASSWTTWNHVRTVSCVAACALLAVASRVAERA